ncbi:low temperature requirement protein A [Spirilliplanes yamanashiensis]|uniref:Membrane protein n=1 Tax=Spirilliplanes yamanashiensis TaxID=42233 RepID=A0A8J4DLC9_9ACTN|nr:low temperature requirement protein A [Spirilliplanes yamanashiensis]MDP9818658.1 low temperature requirement protein LtrA [Spirilliplanes yamanashiensis]GIJ05114.1 membrane protein [Spirilliplanes yamanashiensis]
MTDARDRLDDDERQRLDEQEAEQVEPLRPPDLNQESDRSATRLELFFDLAFVLFVARCADVLAKDETWHGGLVFAAVLTAGWWAWASTTLYANRFDTDDAVFRLLTLAGMAGVVGMAAAADSIAKPEGRWFALAYVVLRLALIAGYLRAWRHIPDARPTILPYLAGHSAGALLWTVSIVVPTPARYWLWAAGVLVDLAGPTLAARLRDAVPLHMEHLPERFGLFVILVLGESVAATVTGVHDGGWKAPVVTAALFAFVVAAALWWIYFDLSGGAAKRRLLEEGDGGTRQGVHDFYVYAHLPVAVSLAAVAVGLEHAVLHGADDHLSAGTRGVLAAGLGGYLLSTTLLQGGLSRQPRSALLWPGAGVPVTVVICLLDLGPVLTLGLLALLVAAGVVTGFLLHRAGEVRTAKV